MSAAWWNNLVVVQLQGINTEQETCGHAKQARSVAPAAVAHAASFQQLLVHTINDFKQGRCTAKQQQVPCEPQNQPQHHSGTHSL
jgi:hypothetical protein